MLAAVAYIGSAGDAVLPLKRGDVLICDATATAVRQGTTSVATLRRYARRGVALYSEPGLHAKVIALPRRAFIGSANASGTSRDKKIEAVIETTDPTAVREARAFVEGLATDVNRLSRARLRDLSTIIPRRSGQGSVRRAVPAALPTSPPATIRVAYYSIEQLSDTQLREIDRTRRGARRRALADGKPSGFDSFVVPTEWEARRWHEGDWVIQSDEETASAPGWVVARHFVGRGSSAIAWIAQPQARRDRVPQEHLERTLRRFGVRDPLAERRYTDRALVQALWRLFS